jgi:hypothetical protein
MEDLLPGKTRWESRQYRKDHGQRASVALQYRMFADFLRCDEDGPAPMRDTHIAVAAPPDVSREEGCAAVDRWAARHHVKAGWDDEGTYRAEVVFGPEVRYRVVYVPADVLDKRLDAHVREDAQAAKEIAA